MDQPGPLVSAEWLAEHLADADLRIVHVSTERNEYDRAHIPGAIYVDLHVDLAKPGTRPETGSAEREYLLPTKEDVAESLRCWGVRPGMRIVFYDDEGQNRHAIRGYWLLRLYGYPAGRMHVLDGGLYVWQSAGLPVQPEPVVETPAEEPIPLSDMDRSLIATTDDVITWSREAVGAPGRTRLLDVRLIDEFVGRDIRARRGGRIPGARNRVFSEFVAPDGRLRTADEAIAILRGTGVEPSELRATYCQGGVRASLVWFVLHEMAGLHEVRNYAGSWEEWGNRTDTPIER